MMAYCAPNALYYGTITVPLVTGSYSTGNATYLIFCRHEREEGGDEEIEESRGVQDDEFVDEFTVLEANQLPRDTEGAWVR